MSTLLKQKVEIIYIDGYYLHYGKRETGKAVDFTGYKCIIGDWDGNEDDNDIFYYFDNEDALKSMMKTKNRTDTEFVVTKVKRV